MQFNVSAAPVCAEEQQHAAGCLVHLHTSILHVGEQLPGSALVLSVAPIQRGRQDKPLFGVWRHLPGVLEAGFDSTHSLLAWVTGEKEGEGGLPRSPLSQEGPQHAPARQQWLASANDIACHSQGVLRGGGVFKREKGAHTTFHGRMWRHRYDQGGGAGGWSSQQTVIHSAAGPVSSGVGPLVLFSWGVQGAELHKAVDTPIPPGAAAAAELHFGGRE